MLCTGNSNFLLRIEIWNIFWRSKNRPVPSDLKKQIRYWCRLEQGQLQEWTEHSHTDLPKSETSRDIKKSF